MPTGEICNCFPLPAGRKKWSVEPNGGTTITPSEGYPRNSRPGRKIDNLTAEKEMTLEGKGTPFKLNEEKSRL